jgi:hypothetical protein
MAIQSPSAQISSPSLVTPAINSRREHLFFAYIPFLVAVAMVFAFSPDDTFIILRYAANLLHGDGLAFNQGQHVQGFTSPLDLLVAVVAYLIPGGFALFKMKLASVIFGCLALREGLLLLEDQDIPLWAFRSGALTMALCPVMAFASINGLETSLEMWLLAAVARRLVAEGSKVSPLVVGSFAFAAVVARPDAVVPLACMALVGILVERGSLPLGRIRWFLGAVAAALVTALVEIIYFKSLLPNTYYAKDLALGRALSLGYKYLNSLLQPDGFDQLFHYPRVVHLVFFLEAVLVITGLIDVFRHRRRSAYVVALIIGQILFVLKSGGDYMPGGRFLAAAAIPFITIETLGLVSAAGFLARIIRPQIRRIPMLLGSCLLVATSVAPLTYVNAPAWSIRGISDESLLVSGQALTLSPLWIKITKELACVPSGELIATSENGYLGFVRQDLRLLDLRGLTSRAIARNSPSAIKQTWGVQDYDWFVPTSPVGRILIGQHPSVIVEFDGTPTQDVLGGRYRFLKFVKTDELRVGLYVPSQEGELCA